MISPDGRQVYVARGRDPVEDLNLLADAISVSPAPLFSKDGSTVAIIDGVDVRLNPSALGNIVEKHIVTKVVADREGKLEVTYLPHRPDDKTLRSLLMAETIEQGNLAKRLPRMAGKEQRLTEEQLQQVKARLRIGEPAERIAPSYGVDTATIRRLAG
jgi:hypothetical protein